MRPLLSKASNGLRCAELQATGGNQLANKTLKLMNNTLDGIAVVGMAARVPGAKNVDEFWENLRAGVESISFFTDEELGESGVEPSLLKDPNYVKAGAVLDNIEWFDASFFGYSPREAELIDPQQRLFLECAWEALESTGYNPGSYKGEIGVYAGVSENDYWMNNLRSNAILSASSSSFTSIVANDKDYVATRASYKLNLRGPAIAVQAACSTSLVAIHLACQALLNGECDMALAGGASLRVPHKRGYLYQDGMIHSPDGHCRPFDARARGTIFGNGLGIVVLKRLADAVNENDMIYAVIKGSAVNNDGAMKIGYTAPSETGQAEVIAEALEIAGVDPATVSCVEAHGTGTLLGDPIEIAALNRAYGLNSETKGFCAIGSVKSNFGHLYNAAGVASFIKATLALKHKQIPASLNFEKPNPQIDFANSPFYVNTELRDWKTNGHPRRAGVSSFGVGGTNAHVVLEEAAVEESSAPSRPWRLLLLSARTETALDAMTANLAKHLRGHPGLNLADVAHTLQIGRKVFAHRRMVVCRDADDAIEALERLEPQRVFSTAQERHDRPVAFMFTGQGSQYAGMARGLYETEPTFRAHVDACCELLKSHLDVDLRAVIYPDELRVESRESRGEGLKPIDHGSLNQTWLTQPALFVVEYALAKLWMEWGVEPRAMIGHSIGEYVAACLAGVFSLEDAMALVATRGRLMQQLPSGAMLSVALAEEQVRTLLDARLSIAAVNAPTMCVVSGPAEDIAALERRLQDQGTACQRLHTSHAFHSTMMEPILNAFTHAVQRIKLNPPMLPFISDVTGTWITAAEATDASYWVRHLRQGVRFGEGVRELMRDPNLALLEVGPGQMLTALARRNMEEGSERVVVPSIRPLQSRKSDLEFILETVGRLWLAGAPVDWNGFYSRERRRRIPLPTYPFERQRYWVEPEKPSFKSKTQSSSLDKRPDIADWFYLPCWKQTAPLAVPETAESEARFRWLAFVDADGFGDRIAQRLRAQNQHVVTVVVGKEFAKENGQRYAIRPGSRDDYEALFADLNGMGCFPDRIIHLWSLNAQPRNGSAFDRLENSQALGFFTLLYLVQTLGRQKSTAPLGLSIVSNDLFDVTGDETLRPENATILGPCKTIPQEYPNMTCRLIDLDGSQIGSRRQTTDLSDRLLAEIRAESSNALVAYRGKHRWIQSFEPLRLAAPSHGRTRLRDSGVYLITGGLGGIGLALAEYLAQTAHAKLVLIGRSSFPDRDNWEQWLAIHGEGDPISHRIRKVKSLELLGAEVLVIAADVADIEQMKAVIEQAKKRFGVIHGVIHAAGIAGGGVIQLKDAGTAADVLSPKVKGTLVLDEVLKDTPLDFLVLCSSVLALRSRAGQVDYCGANAFLDAYAHYKSSSRDPYTVSINWDGWEEVGMAVNNSLPSQAGLIQPDSMSREINHPLLDRLILETPERLVYRTDFRVDKHWVLNEHRISGAAALPGTAYLEMAGAAYRDYFKRGQIEITDVYFLAPLMVDESEQKAVLTVLERDGGAWDFRIVSKASSSGAGKLIWREHARGRIADLTQPAAAMAVTQETLKRLDNGSIGLDQKEQTNTRDKFVYWGPRWQCVKASISGRNEVLARLELAKEFNADLDKLQLHPALLDVATSLAVKHASDERYLPLSYGRLEVHGPLSGTLHVKLDANGSSGLETVTFDALITDRSGKLLVRVEGFSLKRVNDASASRNLSQNGERDLRPDHARLSEVEAQFYESLGVKRQLQNKFEGILPQEGVAAFHRILSLGTVPQMVVSVTDLASVPDRQEQAVPVSSVELGTQQSTVVSGHARPNLQSPYAAPKDDSERIIASIWQEVLGIEPVGVNDNFFELGGDSVIAIQLIAKANKAGFRLAANDIFQHQTIAELALVGGAGRNQEAIKETGEQPRASRSDDFGWTQEEMDRIGRALTSSSN
jgi:acyl transferase domain-containing protein